MNVNGRQETSVNGQSFGTSWYMGIFKINVFFISNELGTVSWPSQAGVLLPGTTRGVERWPYFQHAWHPLRLLCPDCNLRVSQELGQLGTC